MFHVEHASQAALHRLLKEAATEFSYTLTDEQIARFLHYLHELKHWNRTINLTAIEDEKEIIIKHFIDSIACVRFLDIPVAANCLDVGSGAGFPGMPIKLVRPDIRIDFLEPDKKKAAFLMYLVGKFRLSGAKTISSTFGHLQQTNSDPSGYDFIVIRAFKPETYARTIRRMLKLNGLLVLYRASKADFPLQDLALVREVEYELPSNLGHRVLSIFSPS
jgi:16S rRNA (guanine527-N7)-methyltransferase